MNIKWFPKNYIENESQCEFLLEKAEVKYAFTKEQFYEGCLELRKGRFEKDSLETHLDILGKMSLLGIRSSIAGVKIREAIIASRI